MATLYITEYAKLPHGFTGSSGQMPEEPPLAEQIVTISGSSTPSAAFQPTTRVVRLHCDAICSVLFGQSPTATAQNGRLPANQTEFRAVIAGTGMRVAVITNT